VSGIHWWPARLGRAPLNVPQRDVEAIVSEKNQSVKLIKLIMLIETDYRNKIGVKGYAYSLSCPISAPSRGS
jgi:hypothetical protein